MNLLDTVNNGLMAAFSLSDTLSSFASYVSTNLNYIIMIAGFICIGAAVVFGVQKVFFEGRKSWVTIVLGAVFGVFLAINGIAGATSIGQAGIDSIDEGMNAAIMFFM